MFRLGLEGCGPVLVPPFFRGSSPSLVLVVFAWQFQQFGCPCSLSFLELFAGVISSRFRRCLAAEGVTLVFCRACRLALVGLRCLWVTRSCGFMVFALGSPVSGRDCVLPQSAIVTTTFPPSGGFGSWPSCGVPYLRLARCSSTCVSPGGCPSFYQVWSCAFALSSSSQGLVCVGASTVDFSCVFLRDVVTLCVKSVFLSLLIAHEGFHWWLFLSDVANPFLGRVAVFLSPSSASRNSLWLVAALLPGLSLIFDSRLSSPGLICCLAMSLRYVDLLSCGGVPTVCLATGFVAFLPVLRSPAGSSYAGFCGFSSPIWFTTFAMGSPCGVEASLSSIGTKVWFVFSSPFGLFLRVVPALRDIVTIWVRCVGRFPLMRDQRLSLVLRPSSFWMGFNPLSEASLSARSLQESLLVVLAEAESLRLSLALSSVLPCPMLWLHVHLHDTCSQTKVVLGALP